MAGTVVVDTPKTIIETLAARKGYMNASDVAELLGENIYTIYRRVKRGRMPAVRTGFGIKFDPAELAAWLRERHVGKAS